MLSVLPVLTQGPGCGCHDKSAHTLPAHENAPYRIAARGVVLKVFAQAAFFCKPSATSASCTFGRAATRWL